jgi:hypothetical protein
VAARTALGKKWEGQLAKLKSVALTKADKKAREASYKSEPGGNDYPYGLSLELDHATLSKLGMKSAPASGSELTLHARCCVQSSSTRDTKGGKQHTASVQITHLSLGPQVKTGPVIAKRKGK